MIGISLIGINEIADKLAALAEDIQSALAARAQLLADALSQEVRDGKLSGQVLAEKSGLLKSSIESATDAIGTGASVFVSGDVPYAAIQEYGGQTKAHVIEATQGKALAFNWAGKQAFFARVNHPGSNIPERSYLRSSLEDSQDAIVSGFADALDDAIS